MKKNELSRKLTSIIWEHLDDVHAKIRSQRLQKELDAIKEASATIVDIVQQATETWNP